MEFPEINPQWFQTLLSCLSYDSGSPLQIPSVFFLVAFLLFLCVHSFLLNRPKARNLFTLLFSLYLYYKLSGAYVLLLISIALVDWTLAHFIGKTSVSTGSADLSTIDKPRRMGARALVALSVVMNVGVLLFFKANGVFSDLVSEISAGGLNLQKIAVPAGVSFFCFQSISYVVDCYRGKIQPLKNPLDYLFLLSFFPKMFLGPLVSNSDFIAQMQRPEIAVSKEDRGEAVRQIFAGVLKFCVLSKIIGQLFVYPTLLGVGEVEGIAGGALSEGANGFALLSAVYAYTIQLYCDFSGYTDLASGVSLLMGYRLPLNFRLPYHSATITEFWRRWHISLSSWLRDYLYISLGGNRRGRARTYLNLLLTMALGGLWHGFGIMFLLWGIWHGVLLCLHKVWMKFVPGAKPTGEGLPLWRRCIGVVVTFNAVAFGWLMFVSPSWESFSAVLCGIFTSFRVDSVGTTILANLPAFSAIAAAYLLHCVPSSFVPKIDKLIARCGFVAQVVLICLSIWIALQCDAAFFPAATSAALPIYANF